jgi:hypothetical protein
LAVSSTTAGFEQNRREGFRGCPCDDLANECAAREKDEIVGQLQEFGIRILTARHGGHGARIEIFWYDLEQHFGRCRERFT